MNTIDNQMSKTKQLLITIAGCLALGTVLGTAFWLFDGGKTSKKASDCPSGVSGVQEVASVNVYQGKWHKDYLGVMK